jgi:hypothetical protein
MFFSSVHQELSEKQKPPTHQGGGFQPPAEIYLVSFLTTHRQGLSSPIKGTLALHCQVARPVSESFLMLDRIVPSRGVDATGICVIAESGDVSKLGTDDDPPNQIRYRVTGCAAVSLAPCLLPKVIIKLSTNFGNDPVGESRW